MTDPKPGDESTCTSCGHKIVFTGECWDHDTGVLKPKHPASPPGSPLAEQVEAQQHAGQGTGDILGIPNDPLYHAIYNSALVQVQHLLAAAVAESKGFSAEQFGAAFLLIIESLKKPTNFKQNFFDAIRDDPYMSQEDKAYWLSLEDLESQSA